MTEHFALFRLQLLQKVWPWQVPVHVGLISRIRFRKYRACKVDRRRFLRFPLIRDALVECRRRMP